MKVILQSIDINGFQFIEQYDFLSLQCDFRFSTSQQINDNTYATNH